MKTCAYHAKGDAYGGFGLINLKSPPARGTWKEPGRSPQNHAEVPRSANPGVVGTSGRFVAIAPTDFLVCQTQAALPAHPFPRHQKAAPQKFSGLCFLFPPTLSTPTL
jgi:hypothetical protein